MKIGVQAYSSWYVPQRDSEDTSMDRYLSVETCERTSYYYHTGDGFSASIFCRCLGELVPPLPMTALLSWTMGAQRQQHPPQATWNIPPLFFPVEDYQRVQHAHGL